MPKYKHWMHFPSRIPPPSFPPPPPLPWSESSTKSLLYSLYLCIFVLVIADETTSPWKVKFTIQYNTSLSLHGERSHNIHYLKKSINKGENVDCSPKNTIPEENYRNVFSPIERAVSENYVACKYLMQPHLQKQFESFKNLLTLRTPSLRERKNISDVCLCWWDE